MTFQLFAGWMHALPVTQLTASKRIQITT